MRKDQSKYFNAEDAKAQSSQRKELLFVGWTSVRRHAPSTLLNLKYNIISLSYIFSFALNNYAR
jgi:hypothetical protein